MKSVSSRDLGQAIKPQLHLNNPNIRALIKYTLLGILAALLSQEEAERWMVTTYFGSAAWLLFFSAKMDMLLVAIPALAIIAKYRGDREAIRVTMCDWTPKSPHRYLKRCLPFMVLLVLYNLQVLLLLRLNLRELINYSVPLFFVMTLEGSAWLASINAWKRHWTLFFGFWGMMLTIAPWWGVSENTVWNPWMRLSYAIYQEDLARVLKQVQEGKPPPLPTHIAFHRIAKITADPDGTVRLIEQKPYAAFIYMPDTKKPLAYWMRWSLGGHWFIGGVPKKQSPPKGVPTHG